MTEIESEMLDALIEEAGSGADELGDLCRGLSEAIASISSANDGHWDLLEAEAKILLRRRKTIASQWAKFNLICDKVEELEGDEL